MVEQHFCLRWNNYRTNITAEFEVLREGEHFVDVTLACDGRQLKAHKVVLSACSPYFKDLLQGNPCTHPIIILRDVGYLHMRGLLEFMYAGEVNVSQAQLASFLRTAEALKVRGLAESPEPHASSVQAAAAAAAAAAVTNSVADLLALKSSMGSLPLMPMVAHHASNSTGGTPPQQSHHHHHHDSKAMLHAVQISNHAAAAAVACAAAAGIHCSAATVTNNNNATPLNRSCSDSLVNKSDMKSDFCDGEPLPLTMNNNIEQPKDRRSPSPHQGNKRLKCNHSSEGGSAPDSPHSASAAYYPLNTQSNGGSNALALDIPGDDVAHDLSSAGSKLQAPPRTTSSVTKASASPPANGSSNIAVTVASLPPSLVPSSSSPEHLQYVFKSEPLESCGGGSDTEGACGGSWHEDSVGSDGEPLSGPASVGGPDNSLPGGGNGDATVAGGGGNGSLPPALLPHHGGGGSSGTSSSTGHHHHASSSSPPPPPPHHHHHHQQQQQQQQQQHPPHLMHAAMPPQESHLAGLSSDASERVYGLEDFRSDPRGDRGGGGGGGSGGGSVGMLDPLDGGRCSPPLPPSSLPHECQVCGKLISCRRNLWKHMERVHLTNPAVRCSICAKLFKNKYALKDHQRIYHGGLSEPLPSSPHHQHHHPQSQANLLSRILRDARHSGPPHQAGHAPLPRPPCSISVCQSGSLEVRPPRELAPIPHAVSHHSIESLSPYRRRHAEEEDSGGGSGGLGRYPGGVERPPLLPPPSSMPPHPISPSGLSHRDWSRQDSSRTPSGPPHPAFSDLHNLSSKSE